MAHNHATNHNNKRRLQIALAITVLFTIVEVIGGYMSGSLALLADAGHMLTDSMALTLALVAFGISARPADSKHSYGYHRFQILAAFVNGMTLIGIVIWIFIEAIQRLISPPDVAAEMMLYVALMGLAVNVASFVVLHGGDQANLNMRGAVLHVLGDLLGSVAAISAALIIIWTDWMPIDPILSMVVALLIFRSAVYLVRHSAHILLEGAPQWLDIREMKEKVRAAVPEVRDIHHLHVWGLTQERLMLTMHIVLAEQNTDSSSTVRAVKKILVRDFGIAHSTIEVETEECADSDC
jgi:cobalt-zinc-cadmium efflux system protein